MWFSEWTDADRLCHTIFTGLRENRCAQDVRQEPEHDVHDDKNTNERQDPSNIVAGVTITHPERVVYPDTGDTKRDVAAYYAEVGERMLPHVAGRPLTVVRCPKGLGGDCFYQKHTNASMPDPVEGVELREKDGTGTYMVVRDVPGLVTLAQHGALEFHPWGAVASAPDDPDTMIFDLDPGEHVAWSAVVHAARAMRGRLEELGLKSFVRLTGGKGAHVVVPLSRRQSWEELRACASAVSRAMVADDPERYVLNMRKVNRRGKVFIDYLRNTRGATSVACYSTRARGGAPVCTPIRWDELVPDTPPHTYTLSNIRRRLASLKCDPWEGYSGVRQSVTKKIMRTLGTA